MTTSAGRSRYSGQWLDTAIASSRTATRSGPFALSLVFLFVAAYSGCLSIESERQDKVHEFAGATMGTSYSVRIVVESAITERSAKLDSIQKQVDERLEEINRLMSTYDPASELSKFNNYRGEEWFDVSQETAQVVAFALKIAEQSGGAFDPTVGPLVNLWGFGPERRQVEPPSEVELAKVMIHVGHEKLEIREEPPALRKLQPELYVDLSAIAKGFAVDDISQLLNDLGYANSMVEIGGEVRTRGSKPGGVPWRIGVEKPDTRGRSLQRVYPLHDGALATSGDYRNFFEYEDVRYSHTIDPATGRPVQHQLATVTVLADTCMKADALATALLVMGEERGYDWCEERGIAALLMMRDDEVSDGIRELPTPEFSKLHGAEVRSE